MFVLKLANRHPGRDRSRSLADTAGTQNDYHGHLLTLLQVSRRALQRRARSQCWPTTALWISVSVQLDDFNTMFNAPNYVQQFLHIRDALGRQETELTESLAAIQREINELRDGSRLTSDPQAVAQIHEAAQELQTAYDHQRQLSIDVQSLYQSMLRTNPNRFHPTLGGFDPQDMAAPADARNIKSYLRFNGQRDVISTHEDKAADVALNAAQTYCVPKK